MLKLSLLTVTVMVWRRRYCQLNYRLGGEPCARQLEHHAVSRRATIGGRTIEIATTIGNQASFGESPIWRVFGARKRVQHRLNPSRREFEGHAAAETGTCRRTTGLSCTVEIATAINNQPG